MYWSARSIYSSHCCNSTGLHTFTQHGLGNHGPLSTLQDILFTASNAPLNLLADATSPRIKSNPLEQSDYESGKVQ